jgi:Stress responsive A/B Barrel Domain
MLRRFEAYTFDPRASTEVREHLRQACLDSSRFIPEIRHSAVGADVTGAVVDLVWEHAFPSAAAYRTYMEHPFHAAVLDRYLLADSPERVVVDSRLGVGLAGYPNASPDHFLSAGVRRLVFLDMRRAGSEEVKAVADLAASATAPEVSVFARNTLASAWFDGETPVGTGPRWSHLWEQGFRDDAALRLHLASGSEPGGEEGRAWVDRPGVVAALAISYRIEPGWGYTAPT